MASYSCDKDNCVTHHKTDGNKRVTPHLRNCNVLILFWPKGETNRRKDTTSRAFTKYLLKVRFRDVYG